MKERAEGEEPTQYSNGRSMQMKDVYSREEQWNEGGVIRGRLLGHGGAGRPDGQEDREDQLRLRKHEARDSLQEGALEQADERESGIVYTTWVR